MSVTRKRKRISLPVLRTEYLNTGNLVVADFLKHRDHFFQRQNPETWQKPVPIFKLLAGTIFGVVDVKDLNDVRIESFDHFQRRIAGVEVKTVDDQPQVFSINLA